jgi:hypothetical protein
MKTVENINRLVTVEMGYMLVALVCILCISSALSAAEIDWTKVETRTIKTFYPGVASWDFMREQDHGTGAAPVKTMKKGCVDCHVGENDAYDIKADEIITGAHQMSKSKTPLEPEPIQGAKGFLEVKAQVAYDAEQIHMRFQWAGSGASATDPALATDDKIDRISVQFANKIQSFNNYGCYITCHNDQEGMPDDRGGKTKLYTYYSRGKDGLQAKDKLDGYKANGQFIDLWEAGFVGKEVKAEDMYILEDRIEDNNDITATGSYENGVYTMVISRKLASGDVGDIALAEGAAFTIGIAIHDNKNSGRKHYTSFPHAVGLGAAAEINAQKF